MAASVEEAERCLAAVDLPCARRHADGLLREQGESLDALALSARVAFNEGRYDQAVGYLERVVQQAPEHAEQLQPTLDHYRATQAASADFEEVRIGQLVLRHAPGVDVILVDDALEAIEGAQLALEEQLGSLPPQPVLVELYPTGGRFVAASGLGDQAVATTGVVAISKWARLLLTSPRAAARGYSWRDTLVHEYVHQVVSHLSEDKTPVWLQEGIARYLEASWRGVVDPPLDPFSQGAVAQALAEDDLVSFEEMHPSFAFLDSAQRGAVAYAQVQMLVATAVQSGGPGTLPRALEAIRQGQQADAALAAAAGTEDFTALMDASVGGLRSLELVERKLAALPLALDGAGGEFAVDPLLAERADLANFARLGDLLRQAERPEAALVEYARALPADEPASPLLALRMAECHRMLGDDATALALLRRSVLDYPSFALTWRSLGELERAAGRGEQARAAFEASAEVYPFDAVVQGQLAQLHRELGDEETAQRHLRYRSILLSGGQELAE